MNRAAYLDANHAFALREIPMPEPGADEVLIEVRANGICGSDVHFFAEGRLGNFVVTVPYIPGHEASGRVAKVGANVKGFREGEKVVVEPGVACGRCEMCKAGRYNLCPDVVFLSAPPIDGTFRDFVCVRADFVYKVPDSMPFDHAAMVEPAAVAVHAVNRAGAVAGKAGLVLGAGPIGLLTMQAFKAAGGGKVAISDIHPARLALAKALGADEVINARERGDIADYADVVFETAGSPVTTAQLFHAARVGGTAVQVGWPAGNVVNMNVADFLDRELTYVGVNRYANAYPQAIQAIDCGKIRVAELITHKFPFDKTAEAFAFAKEHAAEVVKVVVEN